MTKLSGVGMSRVGCASRTPVLASCQNELFATIGDPSHEHKFATAGTLSPARKMRTLPERKSPFSHYAA
jgi:hypothetical protein